MNRNGETTMHDKQELTAKFWKALRSDMTMMIGLDGVESGHTRPWTAQVEGDHGPIWFFTSTESSLVTKLGSGAGVKNRAIATFTSKGHDLFACVHGTLTRDDDRAVIDRLWNRFVAVWYEGGKEDPKLALLRLDLESAEIWLDGSSLLAGIKMLFGSDPKEEYKDKTAKVTLS
jgi:general stress protein 26